MSMKKYRIERALNNNVLLVYEIESGKERIITGKGIGFGKKSNEIIELDDSQIENRFMKFDKKLRQDYFKLVELIDEDVLEACTEVIIMAEDKLHNLNSRLHIVLTDHISFAVERVKMGMDIHNPFLLEIQNLYPKEYDVALLAREIIEKKLNIKFNDDEVGFIALHLNAAKQNVDVKDTVKNTRILKALVEIIETELSYKVESGLTYNRLINHLRGTIQRSALQKEVENPLLDTLKENFHESYVIAEKIRDYVKEALEIDIKESELGYMTIHIDRVWRMAKYESK